MTEDLFRLPPVRSRCREVRNQDQKATGSPLSSMVNLFWLVCITTCMNSCGLTCKGQLYSADTSDASPKHDRRRDSSVQKLPSFKCHDSFILARQIGIELIQLTMQYSQSATERADMK